MKLHKLLVAFSSTVHAYGTYGLEIACPRSRFDLQRIRAMRPRERQPKVELVGRFMVASISVPWSDSKVVWHEDAEHRDRLIDEIW